MYLYAMGAVFGFSLGTMFGFWLRPRMQRLAERTGEWLGREITKEIDKRERLKAERRSP